MWIDSFSNILLLTHRTHTHTHTHTFNQNDFKSFRRMKNVLKLLPQILHHNLSCHTILFIDGGYHYTWFCLDIKFTTTDYSFVSIFMLFLFSLFPVGGLRASAKDDSVQCDYDGMTCLDRVDLVFPQTTIMQPWRSNGLVCDCLPSCTEHELKLIGRTYT